MVKKEEIIGSYVGSAPLSRGVYDAEKRMGKKGININYDSKIGGSSSGNIPMLSASFESGRRFKGKDLSSSSIDPFRKKSSLSKKLGKGLLTLGVIGALSVGANYAIEKFEENRNEEIKSNSLEQKVSSDENRVLIPLNSSGKEEELPFYQPLIDYFNK